MLGAAEAFEDRFSQCFDVRPEWMPPNETWIDIASEDTPCPQPGSPGITLIRKTHCLKSWKERFYCTKGKTHGVRVEDYRWNMTRDGGGIVVDTTVNNIHRTRDGIAHAKAYNLHKCIFGSAIHRHIPF